MLISDLISLSMRTSGMLGVGQTALAQDVADTQSMLMLMMQQWHQRRWLVYRLDFIMFPLITGKPSYTVGPATVVPTPDVVLPGNYRPANIQSCYLRQQVGSGPNSYPVDFPMKIMKSRQEYDAITLKSLLSWPDSIYWDPIVGAATLYVWPIPIQTLFSLYIAWQFAIDAAGEDAGSTDLDTIVPPETQLAIMYNLALLLTINYKLPPDQNLAAMARSTLNTLRMTNFAMQPLQMPSALRANGGRIKNPMGGFYYPELAAGVPVNSQLG